MEKISYRADPASGSQQRRRTLLYSLWLSCSISALYWLGTSEFPSRVLLKKRRYSDQVPLQGYEDLHSGSSNPYGTFPQAKDPFRFLPCTSETLPPSLNDVDHDKTWSTLFDPDPTHWSWGNATAHGTGIYLCGYFDVPLDYTNNSDTRIARLAVTKFQVSGLARVDVSESEIPSAGRKSARTLVIEPGGPGGSGTSMVWSRAQALSNRLSNGTFDVMGWDPRGVNTSLPAASCFPYGADRDRWALLISQYYEETAISPRAQLELVDAMNDATFASCKETLGDLPRFVSTAFVARDLDQIRAALGEEDLTGYFVSYGTGIGQTYANMFPDRVGRLIMDGTEYVRDHRLLGGFGWTALDNATDAWHDGFLGECVAAGPNHCALARPGTTGEAVTLVDLESRMSALLHALTIRPMMSLTSSSGPSLITYSRVVGALYQGMYNPHSWPMIAQALHDLDQGNTSLASAMLDRRWEFVPPVVCPISKQSKTGYSVELGSLVICADSYDAPQPPFEDSGKDESGLDWWASLWQNMTTKSWIPGDSRFRNVLPCRHYTSHFGPAAEVYRGDLNATLANPVLLIAETYDPATPLRNGRRLLDEMGDNARLIVHHGYGHSSLADKSSCTDEIAARYILRGQVPEHKETDCYADEKPYQYAGAKHNSHAADLEAWHEQMRELQSHHPALF